VSCSGLNCNSVHIQNKKHNLCGECVFKKAHEGKSKQEVYQERANKKPKKIYTFKQKVTHDIKLLRSQPKISLDNLKEDLTKSLLSGHYVQDEVSMQNEINQNLAELEERRRLGKEFNLEAFIEGCPGMTIEEEYRSRSGGKKKKQKSIKQVSEKQAPIERAYRLTCIDMDHTTEPFCTGCGKYQGGDIKLSHSHLISRADCKRIGRPDLISERENLKYHCIDFGMNKGCHGKWENPSERHTLLDYEENIAYIKSVSPEMYLKYKTDA
jgi:hypothetical protein